MSLAPDIVTDIEFLEEVFNQESPPCEADPCHSNHNEPATFVLTHKGAEPRCSLLFCQPCRSHILEWLDLAARMNGDNSFLCKRCGKKQMNKNDIVIRTL